MKKILFLLFALVVGLGISTVFATDMQPPGHNAFTLTAPAADFIPQDMPVPAVLNVDYHVVIATYFLNSIQKISLDVETGSSGGLAERSFILGEKVNLHQSGWILLTDQHRYSKDLIGRRSKQAFFNIPSFVSNCSFKFPL